MLQGNLITTAMRSCPLGRGNIKSRKKRRHLSSITHYIIEKLEGESRVVESIKADVKLARQFPGQSSSRGRRGIGSQLS